jgi:hypothetical protein
MPRASSTYYTSTDCCAVMCCCAWWVHYPFSPACGSASYLLPFGAAGGIQHLVLSSCAWDYLYCLLGAAGEGAAIAMVAPA